MTASLTPHFVDEVLFTTGNTTRFPASFENPHIPLLFTWPVFTSALAVCTSLVLLHRGHHLRTQHNHAHQNNTTSLYRIALLARLVWVTACLASEVWMAPSYRLVVVVMLETLAHKALELNTRNPNQARERPCALIACAPLCLLALRIVCTTPRCSSHPLLTSLRMVLYSLDVYLTGLCAAQWMNNRNKPAMVYNIKPAACAAPAAATTPKNLNTPAAAPPLPAAASPTGTNIFTPRSTPTAYTHTHNNTHPHTPAVGHRPAAMQSTSNTLMNGKHRLPSTTTAARGKAGPYSAMWADANRYETSHAMQA